MDIKHLRCCAAPQYKELLTSDRIAFSVQQRILGSVCRDIITDESSFLICYSSAPYPSWIWLRDDADEELCERIYTVLSESFDIEQHKFNTKYFFAEYLIRRARADGAELNIDTNMLVYTCDKTVAPRDVSGEARIATRSELDCAAELFGMLHDEIDIDKKTKEEYRCDAEAYIKDGTLLFWLDASGERAAVATYRIDGDLGSISHVYTRSDKRRCGYASALIYRICGLIADRGAIPTLYTDGDYEASNKCYTALGFVLRGRLCTVAKQKGDQRENYRLQIPGIRLFTR